MEQTKASHWYARKAKHEAQVTAKGGAVALPSWNALAHCLARSVGETGAARRAGTATVEKEAMYADDGS